tara:strand:- start:12059 stop:12472 length:414 start_codon:yes stop_codon:yes gene_type:complete
MGTRGRKTSATITTLPTAKRTPAQERPKPPATLTKPAAEIWVGIVDRLPEEWFPRETWPILEQYCRHILSCKVIDTRIDDMEKRTNFDVDDYDKLCKMRERETRTMLSLATRMRLTQQSTYDTGPKKPIQGKKLWET